MKSPFHVLCLALLATLVFSSCKKEVTGSNTNSSTPLYALLIGDTSLSMFNAAVQKAGDQSLFSNTDSIAVMLPTNAAFLASGMTTTTLGSSSAATLDSLVRYHYINNPAVLTSGSYNQYRSLLGPAVYGFGNTDGTNNFFNGDTAVHQTLAGSNATVYKLNMLLQPPAESLDVLLSTDSSLSYFREAVTKSGISLLPASGWNTVLAPDNNSFIAAGYPTLGSIDSTDAGTLANMLDYHLLQGQYFVHSFSGANTVSSSEGGVINITYTQGQPQFTGTGNTNAASITGANRIAGTNIIVQKINEVLVP